VLPHLAAFLLAALSPIDSAPVSSAPDLKNRVGDFFSCSSDQVVSHAPATPVNTGENRLYGYENASGIPHYRARYYDPHLGRFISEDPFGTEQVAASGRSIIVSPFLAGEHNLYRMNFNSPNGWLDPTGLASIEYGKLLKTAAVNAFAGAVLNVKIQLICKGSRGETVTRRDVLDATFQGALGGLAFGSIKSLLFPTVSGLVYYSYGYTFLPLINGGYCVLTKDF